MREIGETALRIKTGDIIRFERPFTKEDVELFTKVSKDEGDHHVRPDGDTAYKSRRRQ